MKQQTRSAWVVAMVILITCADVFFVHADFVFSRFAPGETLNPDCSPTDPECSVSISRFAQTYVVTSLDQLNNLPLIQAGDVAVDSTINKSYIRTQSGTWQELLTPTANKIVSVTTLLDLHAINNAAPGDRVIVTSLNQTFIRTIDHLWLELSSDVARKTYVVFEATDLDTIVNPSIGDHAFAINPYVFYVRESGNIWQRVDNINFGVFTVPDLASRDALTNVLPGFFSIVSGVHKSYVFSQDHVWNELLASPSVQRLSNTYVLTNAEERDALSNLQTGDIAILSDTNATFIYTQNQTWQELSLLQTCVTSLNGLTGVISLTTENVLEAGANKYYSHQLARNALTVSDPLSYDSETGQFDLQFESPFKLHGTKLAIDPASIDLATLGGILPVAKGGTGETSLSGILAEMFPPQSGNIGKFLTTNGSSVAWAPVVIGNGGVWGTMTGTLSEQLDISEALSGKEFTIVPGTISQYYRGDKTFQMLNKSAVGLGDVENTALSTWSGSTNLTTTGALSVEKQAIQVVSTAGTNDSVPEWNGAPIVTLTGENILQTFNLGTCASNANKVATIYVRDTNNKARTINATSAEGIIPFRGGAKINYTMKNSAGSNVAAATFYCDGTDWLVISQTMH